MQDESKLDNRKSTILKNTQIDMMANVLWNVLSEIVIGAKMNQ